MLINSTSKAQGWAYAQYEVSKTVLNTPKRLKSLGVLAKIFYYYREVISVAIKQIDHKLCINCGACVNVCSRDVIRLDDKIKKAVINYPEDCNACNCCMSDCPSGAITVIPISPHYLVSW